MPQITGRAMGCGFLAHLDAAGPGAEAALAALPAWLAAWEQALSRFRPESELSRLNRRAGGGLAPLSPTLWAVLAAARAAARDTGGLVTPTVLAALEHSGYDRDFAAIAQGGSAAAPPGPPPRPVDWRRIRLDPARRAVAIPAGARLDLGGVAKGWAADAGARLLEAAGPALVDLGGDIAVSGPRAGGAPWAIGVADPWGGDAPLEVLALARGGVATSGRDYRRWRQGGAEHHHIIDPRSGAPAATDLLSVTVVAPSALEAEAAAKAALILGAERAVPWLDARPRLAALLVADSGAVTRTAGLAAYCWPPDPAAAP